MEEEGKSNRPIMKLLSKIAKAEQKLVDKTYDGIVAMGKTLAEEIATPTQMLAMATDDNKAVMAAAALATRARAFIENKIEAKREKIKAEKAKKVSDDAADASKKNEATAKDTKDSIETGTEKTGEAIGTVSDTIKSKVGVLSDTVSDMMSGSPPYLLTLIELTREMLGQSNIQTQTAKDNIDAQVKSMMGVRDKQSPDIQLDDGHGVEDTEDDFLKSIEEHQNTERETQEHGQGIWQSVNERVLPLDGISNTLNKIYDFVVENTPTSAERIEAARESAVGAPKVPDAPEEKKEKGGILKSIAKAIAIIGVGIIGFAAGFVESIMNQLRAIKAFFKKFKLGEKVFKAFGTIGNLFKGDGAFGKAFAKVGNFFKSIKDFFMKFVTKTKSLSKVFTWMKNIGKVFGKFFLPITILMGAFEVVKGFMAGFKKDGIIGGIIGALDGLIDFLVDAPINMIKDLISWLLKKFGFDDAAASMDAFEFDLSGMLSNAFYGIANWIRGLFGMEPLGGSDDLETPEEEWSLWDTISNALSSVTTWLGELLSMDNLMFALKWFNPLGIISTAFMGIGNWLAGLFNLNLDALIDNILPDNMVGNAARGMLGIEKGAGKKLSADDLQGGKEDTPEETEIPDFMTMTIEDLKKQQGEAYLERIAARSSYLKNAQSENDQLKSKQAQSDAVASIVQNQFNTTSSSTTKPVFSKSHAIEPSGLDFTAQQW
jgi:hypothetical protein